MVLKVGANGITDTFWSLRNRPDNPAKTTASETRPLPRFSRISDGAVDRVVGAVELCYKGFDVQSFFSLHLETYF